MKTAAIIAEFNPFHNGHEYLITKARELGYTCIIAIMSGNFVQRGDLAVFSKFSRAHAAVLCGVDAVVELPTPFAMSGAQQFATGGVYIAKQLGVDAIIFGSECGDIDLLMRNAKMVYSDEIKTCLDKNLDMGMSFISARTAACEETFSSDNIITTPNDTLGVEYIAAASRLYANMKFLSIARLHSTHDCKEISGRFASACGIRSLIHDKSNFENFVPSPAMDIFKTALVEGRYTNIENLETAILFKLRSMSRDDFSNLPDLSEGLENRIYMVSRTAKSLKELYDTIKTKRYSHARIRRIILSAFLDIKSSYKDAVPSYIRVLACNSTGLEHINFARLRSEIPIAMRATEIRNDPTFLFECKATDLYNLGCFNIQDCGEEYKRGLIKIKH